MLNGKSFRVRATVALYQGLFDRNSDIWIPWQHAHSLLFPGFSDQGLLRQPGLYWLIAIAPAGQASSRTLASLARLKNRVDLLAPPWDSIRIAPGITSDLTAHSAADTSSKIYLMGAALMLMVALINLACTTALGRARFVDRELILQYLGVSPLQFLMHTTLLVLVPVALAMAIAPASAWGFRWFLSREPNLRAIFEQAPVQQQSWLHAALDPLWLGFALGAALLGLLLSSAIAHAGGVSAIAPSLSARPARLRFAFRLLLGLLAGICAGTLWFGAMVQVRSGAIAEHLAMPAGAQVAQSAVTQAGATTSARTSDSIWLIRMHSAQFDTDTQTAISQSVAAEFSSTAWMQQTPFLTRAPTAGFVLSESDDALVHPVIKLQSNLATAGVVAALGLKLLAGRDLQNSDEALLDQIAAAELQKQGKSAIGLRYMMQVPPVLLWSVSCKTCPLMPSLRTHRV